MCKIFLELEKVSLHKKIVDIAQIRTKRRSIHPEDAGILSNFQIDSSQFLLKHSITYLVSK